MAAALRDRVHGILVDASFADRSFPQRFSLFAKRNSSTSDWTLYGISIRPSEFDNTVHLIQQAMRDDGPFYAHLYDDERLVVVFKSVVFTVAPHCSTWHEAISWGLAAGIPIEMLDFWPNRFQDEHHYFRKGDFVGE